MGLRVEACHLGNLAGLWSMGLAWLKGGPCGVEIVLCLWITGLAGLRGMAQQRLCRPVQAEGCCLAKIKNVHGSLAWQALGVQPRGDHVGLCRP
jgi:hypothetical protein